MIPGELLAEAGELELNAGRPMSKGRSKVHNSMNQCRAASLLCPR